MQTTQSLTPDVGRKDHRGDAIGALLDRLESLHRTPDEISIGRLLARIERRRRAGLALAATL